ncbi:hypothetical protein NDU88_006136 [Pleurodeles waltl]|uniref:Uncharacterized protein n=1 Tax=Pleurodeles waltl TaxID=8319 RepID=A0AAV7X1N8_PLEWA|nr:hypothetical protein NDU88_006136 [Pleurodeles waltl]
MKDGKFPPENTYTQTLGDCTAQLAELKTLVMALEHTDHEQTMLIVYINGPGVEAADTPFDINDRVTVLQDLQQFRSDNAYANAASFGIRDVPVRSTGCIPKLGDLMHEKIVVKKEFGPSHRAPVLVLGIHGTRTVILLPLPGSKENPFVSIYNVKLHHVANTAQQT